MLLMRDQVIMLIFIMLISGATGGLIATLLHAYYHRKIRKEIEDEIRIKLRQRTLQVNDDLFNRVGIHDIEDKFHEDLKKEIEIKGE